LCDNLLLQKNVQSLCENTVFLCVNPIDPFNKSTLPAVQNDDLELLKLVLAAVNSSGEMKGGKSALGFSQCDFNIVSNLLRTLQVKQVYLYNLAKSWKELAGQVQVQKGAEFTDGGQNRVDASGQMPFPLLVDYEEMTLFRTKR